MCKTTQIIVLLAKNEICSDEFFSSVVLLKLPYMHLYLY